MNRRNFLKTSALTSGTIIAFPQIFIAAPKPKISWEDFDWMTHPSQLAFRYEVKNGITSLNSISYTCKCQKTKLSFSENEPDLTKETKSITRQVTFPCGFEENPYTINLSYTVYTNETLLLEAQKMGFTHLHMFATGPYTINPVTLKKQFSYLIYGAKLPDWKTNQGKLQTVNL